LFPVDVEDLQFFSVQVNPFPNSSTPLYSLRRIWLVAI